LLFASFGLFMKKYIALLCLAFAGPSVSGGLFAESGLFPDGTRHVAMGDSITHRGTYVMYLQLFALTRFPDRSIEFLNAGIAGDTAGGGTQRVGWDVLALQPNSVSLMFGMNDVGRDLYKPGLAGEDLAEQRRRRIDSYERNMRDLIKALQAAHVAVTLITPSIFDETSTMDSANFPGVDSLALEECTRRAFQMAQEYGLPLVDFHGPMQAINREQQRKDPAFTMIGKDRVHPGEAGHLVMAWLFLKARLGSSEIARAVIDAATGKVGETGNCTVDDVRVSPGSLQFRYAARAIPFPIDDSARPALDWVPINTDLNREILKVSGLAAGDYHLQIDDRAIREYSAGELAEGINLALEPGTPQYRQAQEVLRQLEDYWKVVQTLRDIVVVEYATMGRDFPRPLTYEQVKPKLDERLAGLTGNPSEAYHRRVAQVWIENKANEALLKTRAAEDLKKIREAAQPFPHTILLTRIER